MHPSKQPAASPPSPALSKSKGTASVASRATSDAEELWEKLNRLATHPATNDEMQQSPQQVTNTDFDAYEESRSPSVGQMEGEVTEAYGDVSSPESASEYHTAAATTTPEREWTALYDGREPSEEAMGGIENGPPIDSDVELMESLSWDNETGFGRYEYVPSDESPMETAWQGHFITAL